MFVAEVVGFAIPGAVWIAAWSLGLPAVATAILVIAGGAGEGAVLGYGQWRILRRRYATGVVWVRATSLGAAVAWSWGMAPSTLHEIGAPLWASVVAGVFAAPMLLLAMPVLQWWVVRESIDDSWRWIPWNLVVWSVALPPTFLAPALLPADAWAGFIAVTWLAAGTMMAGIVALGTGIAARRVFEVANRPTEAKFLPQTNEGLRGAPG